MSSPACAGLSPVPLLILPSASPGQARTSWWARAREDGRQSWHKGGPTNPAALGFQDAPASSPCLYFNSVDLTMILNLAFGGQTIRIFLFYCLQFPSLRLLVCVRRSTFLNWLLPHPFIFSSSSLPLRRVLVFVVSRRCSFPAAS